MSMHIVLKRGSIDNPLTFNNDLYTKDRKKHLKKIKNEQRSKDAAAKKDLIQVE